MRDFVQAAFDAGLLISDPIDDGVLHRCGTRNHPRSKNGAYLLFPDGLRGGFQNWDDGASWCKWVHPDIAGLSRVLKTPPLPRTIQIQDRDERHRKAAALANELWNKAKEGPHPYLDKKGICSTGTRVLDDKLLVPMMNQAGKITSLQFILPSGKKWFMKDGEVKACRMVLRQCGFVRNSSTVYLCEGYATACTVHAASAGVSTVVCFTCNGIAEVARSLKSRCRKQVIICADNDYKTKGNPGLTKAREAAKEIGAKLLVPTGIQGTDFNDMMIEKGIFFVEDYIKYPVEP